MKKILFLAMTFFLAFSCSTDDNNKVNIESPESCMTDMINFNSMDEFSNFMTQIHTMKISEVKNTPTLRGFNSMLVIDDEMELRSEAEALEYNSEKVVQEEILAAVINGSGEVKIEDVIYQFGNEYVFGYLNCIGKSQIDQFYEDLRSGTVSLEDGEELVYSPQLFVFKIESFEEETLARASQKKTYNYESKRRVKGVMFQRNLYVFRSIGVKTKNQKKSWGVWWNKKTDRLEVSWDVTFYNTFLQAPVGDEKCAAGTPFMVEYINDTGNKVETDENHVTHYFDFTVGGGITTTGGEITGGISSENLTLAYARHSNFRNTLSDHNVDYKNRRHSTCTVYWYPCEGSAPNCSSGSSTSIPGSGNGGNTGSSCQPACPPGYFCLNGNCIESGPFWECIPPCPPGEQCINGNCVPL